MSLRVLEPVQVLQHLRATDHLAECCSPHRPFEECDWCHWALCTPEATRIMQIQTDSAQLLSSKIAPSVAWVIACSQLLESFQDIDLSQIRVPGSRVLAGHLHKDLTAALVPLRKKLAQAVSENGPVAQRCAQTAGVLTAAAIQQPQHAALLAQLPSSLQEQLRKLATSLSSQLQIAGMLPLIDHLHWQGLPSLDTQPEWDRRPQPGDAAGLKRRQLAGTNLEAGSLESIVVESMFTQLTEQLVEMSEQLRHAAPPITVSRPLHQGRYSQRTRNMLFRIAKIDWHLSFVDTGYAACWDTRIEGDHMVTDLPWQVAMAIEACEAHGLVSACYQDTPHTPSPQLGLSTQSSLTTPST